MVDPAGELVEPVYITEPAATAAVAPVVIEEPKQPATVKVDLEKPYINYYDRFCLCNYDFKEKYFLCPCGY